MSALVDLSAVVNRLTGGNSGAPDHPSFWFDSRIQGAAAAATVSGRLTSLWRYNKSNGANGAIPSSVAACDKSLLGAMPFTNPAGGRQKWLLGLEGGLAQPGILVLYDRLLHIGGLNATTTTAQTVGGSLSRYTGGAGNQIWVEIYTQIGTTATTITASYTNQAGTSGRTTLAAAFGGTGLREESRVIPLALQDGDTGVQSVQSVTLAATTGTAGNFGIVIAKPILYAPCEIAGGATLRDTISGLPSTPEIMTDACLAFAFMASVSTSPQGLIGLHMVDA